MKSKRKPQYIPKGYESKGSTFIDNVGRKRQETNASIYESMLTAAAFIDLTAKQKVLYLYVKAQQYGHHKPKQDYKELAEVCDRDDLVYFPWKAAQEYGLYKESDHSHFYEDIRSLLSHGFVERFIDGSSQREKTVYLLSDKWQTWQQGTDYAPKRKARKAAAEET